MSPPSRRLHKILAASLACWLGLAPVAGATWSIVIANSATGEVAVGTATCLASLDLSRFVPVIVVGHGAGAAQAAIDEGAVNRKKMFKELGKDTPPVPLIKAVKQGDIFKFTRQYGVANLMGQAGAFTGNATSGFKGHLFGTEGALAYSIQGNVLTGLPVLQAAEAALLNTTGPLTDRLMAAMEAARAMGGDGRCSCSQAAPQSCGSPPVDGFAKSSHIATVILARVGDTDGPCNSFLGCASGDYFLRLTVVGGFNSPDPVFTLQDQYARFRTDRMGHADGVTSMAHPRGAPRPLPDGSALAVFDLDLRDLDGLPLNEGGAKIGIDHAEGSAGSFRRQIVQDHGDGTYTVILHAKTPVGTDRLQIEVRDGSRPAVIYPYPEIIWTGR